MADNETIKAFECCYVEDSRLDCNECPIKDACNDFGVRDAIKDLNNCCYKVVDNINIHSFFAV